MTKKNHWTNDNDKIYKIFWIHVWIYTLYLDYYKVDILPIISCTLNLRKLKTLQLWAIKIIPPKKYFKDYTMFKLMVRNIKKKEKNGFKLMSKQPAKISH